MATVFGTNLCYFLIPSSFSPLESKTGLPPDGRRFLRSRRRFFSLKPATSVGGGALAVAKYGALIANSSNSGVYTVGDFMTKKEELHTVKPTTTVDEALQMLVEHRITGFPVIDDDWKLVGVVSDYDLLALDSISETLARYVDGSQLMSEALFVIGSGRSDTSLFPEVDSTWKTFNEIQKLLTKTNGKVIGELMTPAPLVVRETTNLGDAARLLLETKYRRLPVVDSDGKLIGLITRGNVVRAALEIKRAMENGSQA